MDEDIVRALVKTGDHMKTAFIINLALRAAQHNAVPVRIFSLEMKSEALLKRMLSCLGEINGMKLKNPYHYLDKSEKDSMVKGSR